ncbi:HAD-IA family hydrolase [Sphingosinicella sp. BN140058]|uniref:HAD-IA family hydrolase n=1 Tax=Sphingosinicella sp. BN140058 TaxID=1892855 RepID=UPI001011D2D9|nr:HAD-IA family hydrolase [Sphingosinicella sp. BN140058]QAY77344.1 HAD family hydrolase [Sphingosinicella sp. BN140058]
MNRLAIFDCDGTLVDGQANICLAMEACFAEAGLPQPARDRTRRIVGLSLVEAMQDLLPEADASEHRRMADAYKRAYQALRARGLAVEPLYDGIADVLAEMEADGWLLGIATGKSDRGLAICLDHHGLAHHFCTLQTADRHPSKPHPSMIETALADAGADPARSMMIGDTSYDMIMAKQAGVVAVGVSWGYHPPEELLAAGADIIVHAPREIAALMKAHV